MSFVYGLKMLYDIPWKLSTFFFNYTLKSIRTSHRGRLPLWLKCTIYSSYQFLQVRKNPPKNQCSVQTQITGMFGLSRRLCRCSHKSMHISCSTASSRLSAFAAIVDQTTPVISLACHTHGLICRQIKMHSFTAHYITQIVMASISKCHVSTIQGWWVAAETQQSILLSICSLLSFPCIRPSTNRVYHVLFWRLNKDISI